MIVLVSDNDGIVTRIGTLLKQKGDVFTVAADEISAVAAIRSEHATLLIVDTASESFNGYALCRSIRDDPDLAQLPVLCLIDLSDVTTILSVLDCGADGFLTPPVDLSSMSSAIGDILDRQAEGVARAQVASRFRVNHDGREFSVLADRRQLLEFLLAAFDSAVRLRCDIEQVREDCKRELATINKRLGAVTTERDGTVGALHRELEERKEALASAVATLREKEQSEAFLKARFENVAQELKDLGTALEETRKSDQEKTRRIATLESDSAEAAIERKKTEQELNARIAAMRAQLNDATLERDSARSTVAALDVRLAGLERELATALSDLSLEKDAGTSLSADLKNMIAARDTELQARQELEATLAETRAAATVREQEFRSALDRLNADMHALQAALEQNLRQLENELAVQKDLERDVEGLAKERDSLTRAKDMLEEKCSRLQGDLQETIAVSGARERETRAALDNVTNDLHAIQSALDENLQHLEQELRVRKDLEQEVAGLSRERDALSRDIRDAQANISDLKDLLAAEKDLRTRFESDLLAIRDEHNRVRVSLSETARSLEQVQEEKSALAGAQEREREAQQEISALNVKITGLNGDLEKLREENTALAEVREKERIASVQVATLQEKVATLVGELETLQEERRALAAVHEKELLATGRAEGLEAEIAGLNRELEQLRHEKQEAEQNAGAEISRLKEDVAGLNRKVAEHQSAIEKERESSANAGEKIHILTGRFAEAQRSLASASEEIGTLKTKLEEEQAFRRAAEDRLGASEKGSAEKNRVITLLQDELEAARAVAAPAPAEGESRTEPEQPSPPSPGPAPEPTADTMAPYEPAPDPMPPHQDAPKAAGESVAADHRIAAPFTQATLAAGDAPVSLPVPEVPVPQALPAEPPAPQPVLDTAAQVPDPVTMQGTGKAPSPATGEAPASAPYVPQRSSAGDLMISRDRWLDIIKWAHHAEALTTEERKNLVADLMRLARLVQKGRHLTNRQEQEIRALVARVQAMGYRFV